MADRYDLKVARTDRTGKTWWTKIGVMFPMRERDGFSLTLEALPIQTLADDGRLECRITAWGPFKEGRLKGNGGQQPLEPPARVQDRGVEASPPASAGTDEEKLDDKIPF